MYTAENVVVGGVLGTPEGVATGLVSAPFRCFAPSSIRW
jgi:hypothetical protein